MGLEFNVELTYPVDQAIGTAMIFACGQIQAAIFILVSGALEQPLTAEAEKLQVKNRLWHENYSTRCLNQLSSSKSHWNIFLFA